MSSLLVLFWNKKLLSKCNKGPICKGHKNDSEVASISQLPQDFQPHNFFCLTSAVRKCRNYEKGRKTAPWLVCRVGGFSFLISLNYSDTERNLLLTCNIPKTRRTGKCEPMRQFLPGHCHIWVLDQGHLSKYRGHIYSLWLSLQTSHFSQTKRRIFSEDTSPHQYTHNFLTFKETLETKNIKAKKKPPTHSSISNSFN